MKCARREAGARQPAASTPSCSPSSRQSPLRDRARPDPTGGRTLSPSVELGLRHDGGDAETGTGFELGADVGYADPSRGLDMALRLHGLAAHAEDGYDEWGVDPGGSERLWTLPDAHALAANDDAPLSSRFDTEIGYGLGGLTGLGTLTPYAPRGARARADRSRPT